MNQVHCELNFTVKKRDRLISFTPRIYSRRSRIRPCCVPIQLLNLRNASLPVDAVL